MTTKDVKKHSLIFFLLSWLCAAGSFASTQFANVQSLESIQAAAVSFVESRLSSQGEHFVTAAPLDPRLRLQACSSELEAFAPSTTSIGARTTVGVRCSAPAAWTLYVPVSVEVEIPVLVLKHPLARRSRVTVADVEPQVRRVPGSATNFVSDVASLQGHRLKRPLPAGAPVTVDALMPDILVRRGQQVTLIAAVGGVEIRAKGQALTEGGVLDRVRVQNVTSLKVVEGVVEKDGSVRVDL